MIDNLRRTVTAPLALATLLLAWTVSSASALWWSALVVASVLVPAAMPVVAGLIPHRKGISKRSHLRDVGGDLVVATAQVILEVTFLAHQALLMLDAVARTLVRLLITGRHLLEWQTAAQVKAERDLDIRGFYRRMVSSVAVGVIAAVLVATLKPSAAWIAAPFVMLWIAAPLVARQISLPAADSGSVPLDAQQIASLRLVARRTWRFFDEFVRSNEHGLPPDNFQDDPQTLVAHRTSPTNIGMYLLSTVSARDFGWIGTIEMVERLEATLTTIARVERYHGHLYNWYDTRDLQRLEPEYVSTVDSGNYPLKRT